MIVTIFGANGNLSVRITRLLLQKPNVALSLSLVRGREDHVYPATPNLSVREYARNISKIPEDIRNHQQYEAIQGEVTDKEKIRGAVRGADVVVCQYQGFDDVVLDGQKRLVDICEEEKVDRFFSSAFVGDIRGMKVGQHERMSLTLQIFQYLKTKKLRSVHMMCGAFIETWLEYSGVIDLDTNTVSYWGTGDEIWDLTSYDDSAAYTAEVILDKSADGYLKFAADRLSPRGLAEVYERVTGQRPKLVHHGILDDLYKHIQEQTKKHEGQSPWLYLPLFYTYYTANGAMLMKDPLDNSRYPHIKPQTVEEFIKTHDLTRPENLQAPISKSTRVEALGKCGTDISIVEVERIGCEHAQCITTVKDSRDSKFRDPGSLHTGLASSLRRSTVDNALSVPSQKSSSAL
ncbi:hypothetical protein FNYG_15496 [Fusarium nygamai]|uniref:NmrA-like domain-containing protein n=1 Tax=Gibberella nygamai TaxID=42673 RepID=A0A2K0UCN1_GIBNY|nr:hypothetical protein FNYG_15496 [Fusarium nygamai]